MMNSKKIAASIGGIIVLILAIIAFVVSPILGDSIGRQGIETVVLGKWNGVAIDNGLDSPFVEQYRYLKQYADRQNMVPKDPQTAEYFEHQLLYLSFRLGVIQTAMEEEVKNAGYTVPLFKVNKELVNYYLDENGSYSDLKYSQTSEPQRNSYRKSVEKYLTGNRYIEDIFGNGTSYGLKNSSKESAFVVDMAKKERSFKYVSFNFGMYPASELKKFGEEHTDLFTKYSFSLLTYPTEEEAKKMLVSLKNEDVKFDDAVILNTSKTLTDDAGKLIADYRTDINKYFPDNEHLKQILELKPDEISSVVTIHNGMFGIVRCDAEPVQPDFSGESLLEHVRTYMNRTERGTIEDYLVAAAKRFSEKAKTDGFEKAAEEFKETTLTVETTNSFGLNYGNSAFLQPLPSQAIFTSLAQNENFFTTAFTLKTGEISEPILIGSGAVVLTLNEEKDVDQYTLDSTKTGYETQAGSWFAYYHAAMIMGLQGMQYPLPVAHTTLMDYVWDNPKFENNFNNLFN